MRSPSPSAKRISVVLGASEMIRLGGDAGSAANAEQDKLTMIDSMIEIFFMILNSPDSRPIK